MKTIIKLAASAAMMLLACAAQAAPVTQFCGDRYCANQEPAAQVRHHRERHVSHHRRHHHERRVVDTDQRIVEHPSGCPSSAFCGCGASIYALGRNIRSLWLARNWLGFPPARPGAGMAAVFGHHHVAIIIETFGDGTAMLYDANSGRHQTRIHRRSIANASIRNPHGSNRYAGL